MTDHAAPAPDARVPELDHVRHANGQCCAWCYACERRALLAQLEARTQERDEARKIVTAVNNEVIGSQGYFTMPSCVEAVGRLKQDANASVHRAERAEAALRTLREQIEQLPRYSGLDTEVRPSTNEYVNAEDLDDMLKLVSEAGDGGTPP